MSIKFKITLTAQSHIQLAIKWLDRTSSTSTARDDIKGLIGDFKNQLLALPECGKQCEYFELETYREVVKGKYRFIYRLEKFSTGAEVTLIAVCHTRMNYQTLLAQTPEFIEMS